MKRYFKNPLVHLGLIFGLLFFTIYFNNDYLTDKVRKCKILDKMYVGPGYKVNANFYLILKEERNIVFDLTVSPATYSQAKVGNTIYFELRQMDIKQTQKENLIFFAGQIIFGVIGFVCLLLGSLTED